MRRFWRWIQRRPALVRIILGLLGVVAIAAPLWIPLYRLEATATAGQSIIATPLILFLVFLCGLPRWLRRVHKCEYPWRLVGMHARSTWLKSWLTACLTGISSVGLLYGLQLMLGWGVLSFTVSQAVFVNLMLGLLVGVGVGLVEEILFRGWMLFELEQNYTQSIALWIDAGIFALAHYLGPISSFLETWPQLLGLILLGLTLVWARRIPDGDRPLSAPITTLGPAAGLHSGLVFAYYQVDVNDWVIATERVPVWVTGVGGNPLAGLLGLGLLGCIATGIYGASHQRRRD